MSKITVQKLSEAQKKELCIPDRPCGVGPWAVWECGPSTFPWHYDSTEDAYIYEGKVKVKTAEQQVEISAGDFVTFPSHLSCTWTIEKKIKKVYRFR